MGIFLNRYGLVLVKMDTEISIEDIADKLQINLDKGDDVLLKEAVQADQYRIGKSKDNLMICTEDIFDFFSEELGELPKKLLSTFNKQEMAAVHQNSVVDLFGYSYFINGKRIRTLYGEEDKIRVDIGKEMEFEKEETYEELKSRNQDPFIDDTEGLLIQKISGIELNKLLDKEIKMTKF
jgi:hypothetical protein